MPVLTFAGNLVGATSSFNDDGNGGVGIELDQDQNLDGSGNPYYLPSDVVQIEIDDADVGPDGELAPNDDGEVNVLSITVNGVEQLTDPDKIKFDAGGGLTEMGDGYFFVEAVKLTFISPEFGTSFQDATPQGGKLTLQIAPRIENYDFDNSGGVDVGTAEVGDGVYNTYSANIPCFVAGTMIRTPEGEVPVDALRQGDLVETLDRGAQRIRMIVHRTLDFTVEDAVFKPIEIKRGSLGPGLPIRRLCVSPQHRILITAAVSDTGDSDERLVPAKGLTHHAGIRQMQGCKRVEYFHLIFDQHEVVFSEGVATESFYPGPMAVQSIDAATRKELFSIFPQIACSEEAPLQQARPFIAPGKARRLLPRRIAIGTVSYDGSEARSVH